MDELSASASSKQSAEKLDPVVFLCALGFCFARSELGVSGFCPIGCFLCLLGSDGGFYFPLYLPWLVVRFPPLGNELIHNAHHAILYRL